MRTGKPFSEERGFRGCGKIRNRRGKTVTSGAKALIFVNPSFSAVP
jgi:hypothetical protein